MNRYLAGLAVAGALLCAGGLEADPIISFDGDRVIAQGINPGGDAVFFSVSREQIEWMARVVPRAEIVTDGDRDGEVELLLDGGVPWKSFWAVVDVDSGDFGTATPGDFPLQEATFDPSTGVQSDLNGLLNRLVTERESVDLLVVRPHVAAWRVAVADGGALDEDQTNDWSIRIQLDLAENLYGDSFPLEQVSANDTIIGVDPRLLEFFALRFNPGS